MDERAVRLTAAAETAPKMEPALIGSISYSEANPLEEERGRPRDMKDER